MIDEPILLTRDQWESLCKRAEAAETRTRELEAEVVNLQHDVTNYMTIANDELNRAEAAEAEIKRLRDLITETVEQIEIITKDEKEERKEYCGVCGEWLGGPVLCCANHHTKPSVTKTESVFIRQEKSDAP